MVSAQSPVSIRRGRCSRSMQAGRINRRPAPRPNDLPAEWSPVQSKHPDNKDNNNKKRLFYFLEVFISNISWVFVFIK